MNVVQQRIIARRMASAMVDWTLEIAGGLLGSYFGVMIAALLMSVQDQPGEEIQSSMWHGFGFGFIFWALSISFINRVLIQGVSRASIGKKIFKIELISSGVPLTWKTMVYRWVLAQASLAAGGLGYLYALIDRDGRAFHDLMAHTDVVPEFQSQSVSVEYRHQEELPRTEVSGFIVLSSGQAERPSATVIQLPVRTQTKDDKKAA